MGEHTPTPWFVDGLYVTTRSPPSVGASIADCGKSPILNRGIQAANAAFIVLACNNHDRLTREREALKAALLNVRAIISEGALTGFNYKDGDWGERLFASQQVTSAALRSLKDPA